MKENIKKATRESFGMALAKMAGQYPQMVVLDADLAKATRTDLFRTVCPERFVDCGIAEANMMGVAAGLAASGKLPVAATFAMFSAERAMEQIRNSIGYPHLNVKIAGTHAGISVGEDGASHQCNEDCAAMRSIPGMTILCPSDHYETMAAVKAMLDYDGPVYLRLGRLPVECINREENYSFQIGKSILKKEGRDAAIIAAGSMVYEAMKAADLLESEGIHVRVLNMHTLKPLDEKAVILAARETGAIITAEEHSVIGGLGDAVGDVLLRTFPVPMEKIGIQDRYGYSGPGGELMDQFGLRASNLIEAVHRILLRKQAVKESSI